MPRGALDGGVVHRGNDQVRAFAVAGGHLDRAAEGEVAALGGAGGPDDLGRRGADGRRDACAGVFQRLGDSAAGGD